MAARRGGGRRSGGRRGGSGSRGARSSSRGRNRGGGRARTRRDERPPRPPPDYKPPPPPGERPETLRPTDRVFRGLNLYPFQARAVDAIAGGHSVIVSAPTGAGKTLVADYAISVAFRQGWRVVYTAPIKALSNQKFRDFRAEHGDQVGIMTGDVTINPGGDLLVMTTEVFRNTLFDDPERLADFRFVVHDEVHYLDDPERGTVWEESIIHAPPNMRLVCLSATVPNVEEFAEWIESVRQEQVTVVEMHDRPVPLDHMCWLPEEGPVRVKDALAVLQQPFGERRRMRRERSPSRLLDWLVDQRLLPVLYFAFSRRDCEALAGENAHRQLLGDEDSERVGALFDELAERYSCTRTPALASLRRMACAGVGFHHAGMLPVHKEIVERLFTTGNVRMLFCTSTFALGINMPARSVAFAGLRKFDGEKMDYMLCREYGQMAGRAGRQGLDAHGLVISRIEPSRDKPRGVKRVLTGATEPVLSRWNPDYGTLLTHFRRMGDRVALTYAKSFAKFQRERGRGKQRAPGDSQEERLLRARLAILSRTGHIDREQEPPVVTEKGGFVARVKGYEIQAGEWRESGLLDELDHRQLAALLMATVYEPRQDHESERSRMPGLRRLEALAGELIEAFREEEWHEGLLDLTQRVHFGLTRPLELWLDGRPLTDLADVTSVRAGDMVRNFRLLLLCARQIRRALPDTESDRRDRIADVMRAVNRDEVDARRQLDVDEEEDLDEGEPGGEGVESGESGESAAGPDTGAVADATAELRAPPPPEDDEFGAGLL